MNISRKFRKLRMHVRSGTAPVDLLIHFLVFLIFTILFWGILGALSSRVRENSVHTSSVDVADHAFERSGNASWITAKVRNRTESSIEYVKVVFALYSKEGEYVGITFDHTYDLSPGETADLKAYIPSDDQISTYSLVFAEGWDPWR